MGDKMPLLDKKHIIIKNALQILDHLENLEFPRWKEFINRKITTFISTIWQLYVLGDDDAVRSMMHKIVELEIIRDNPELALGTKVLSLDDVVKNTSFDHIRFVDVDEDKQIVSAMFEIVNPKEKKYTSKEEARRNQIGGAEYCIDFAPNFRPYNKIVATHYRKALEKKDIISLVSAAMYFIGISDTEIQNDLLKYFDYSGSIPLFTNLKYVAIVWGNSSPLNPNQATLSIPCKEMQYNNDNGEYSIFFSRGFLSSNRDVVQYSDEYFIKTKYDNFSQIYSAKFNGTDACPFEVDNFYAIFA